MTKTERLQMVGSRIRSERRRLDYNQVEFASAIGVGRLSIVNYESGETSPNADVLLRMKDVGVEVGFVLSGEVHQESIDSDAMEKAVELLLKMVFDLKTKPDAKAMNEFLLHFYRSIRSLKCESKASLEIDRAL